ncbi:hypothetical protein LDO31_08590 [Luteimonas sp. XNQY3]|nr:CheR family methyltransferase [Luteimonas sp. XNQY3]MCD9006291.1 hypothetical protein [Luteimonas sp. XNQY3]
MSNVAVPARLRVRDGVVVEMSVQSGETVFEVDAASGHLLREPDDLADGPLNARVYRSEGGRLVALFRNFDAHLTVVMIDRIALMASYDALGRPLDMAPPGTPQFQFIALIRPLWRHLDDAQTRRNLLTFLEVPRTLGPRRLFTRADRYEDSIDRIVLDIELPPGAVVHDSAAGPGAATLGLAGKLHERGVHVVFSDREFELRLVRSGDACGVFDIDGTLVSCHGGGEMGRRALEHAWARGDGVAFDRIDWRVEEFMQRHAGAMSRRTIDLVHDDMAQQEFDLVRNMNMLQYFSVDMQRVVLKRLAATVKDGGWLVVGTSDKGLISHGVWRRQGHMLQFVPSRSRLASGAGGGGSDAAAVLATSFSMGADNTAYAAVQA